MEERIKQTVKAMQSTDDRKMHEKADAIIEHQHLEELPPDQQLAAFAAKQAADPYIESKMKFDASYLRKICHVKGCIMLVVDDMEALKTALKLAERALGPTATNAQLFAYAEQNRSQTILMSVNEFRRKISVLMGLANGDPHFFGVRDGGSAFGEIMENAMAVVREADQWLRKHNNHLTPELYQFITGTDQLTGLNTFETILGKDWMNDRDINPDIVKLLKLKK